MGFWERSYATGAFCQKCPIYGQFGPLWTSVRPPNDNFWSNKWYYTIALDVPHLDLTLIHQFEACGVTYGHKRVNYGLFEQFWHPLMAIPDPGKCPHTSPWMCPTLIQP